MSIIVTVAKTLQTVLGPALDSIGRDTGVIRRQRKFSGASLLKTLVLTFMKSPGSGGKSGSGKAAVKIQAVWELLTGGLTKLMVQPGRSSDAKSEEPDGPVVPGSLTIRDLGYFCIERFRALADGGAYWISRW